MLCRERLSMNPIDLEIVAPVMSTVEMSCRGCGFILVFVGLRRKYRTACTSEYPEEWKRAGDTLAQWIHRLTSVYRHRIRIRVIDAQSPVGLWKQIRHRVFHFPAFIVDKKHTYVGWDSEQLEALLDEHIRNHL